MKTPPKLLITGLTLLALSTFNPQLSTAFAQGTAFTYQGHVTDNGTNFTGAGQFKFALVTSTNIAHQATATAIMTGSAPYEYVSSFNLISGGSGYLTAPTVNVTGGGGSGAAAQATISGGVVSLVFISPGSGYSGTPTVTIAPPPPNISYTSYWSNDGTSSAGSEPAAAVSVAVTNGLFTVALGDTTLANMASINATLFTQPNLQLRIWFNDGVNGSAALSPVQNLTPVPYASVANSASNLLGVLPTSQLTGTFTGNGSGLTSLNPASLSAGTANINISGSAATAVNGVVTIGAYADPGWITSLSGAKISGNISGNAATATTANNFSSSLAGDVSGTQSATTVASVGGQTAANIASGVSAANAATSTAAASTMVKRDASGNFSAGSITLGGSLTLPATTATTRDTVYSGSSTLLLADNSDNFFAGIQAGNLTTSGTDNTASGYEALYLNTSGDANTANGYEALHLNTGGASNQANGFQALFHNSNGSWNTADGTVALYNNTSGNDNTAVGEGALVANTTGFANIALGFGAGNNITTGNNNIDIGNAGVAGESGIIRIGTPGTQTATYLAGAIYANSTVSATNTVYLDAGAQNTGTLIPGLIFGGTGSSEGISSKRTSGTDQYGIDFYTQGIVRMTLANNGDVGIGTTTPGYLLVVGSSGSPAYCNGTTWQNGSDRNSKEAFTTINPRAVLEKVSALPITEWKYKVEADGTEHLGPMAQDFHAAFGLNGPDDKHIATVDEEGVALAAIQGLNQKVEEKDARIQEQAGEIADLKARLEKLEQLIITKNGGGQ